MCSIDDCPNPAKTRGWCPKHYQRWLRHGSPHAENSRGPQRKTEAERFWSKVATVSSGCMEWQGATADGGYGSFSVGPPWRNTPAHRWAYEAEVGPIPEGLQLDHLCRNTPCVNPTHLEPVTQRENILRGVGVGAINARKTHCPQGHPLSGANLYVRANGARRCRTCVLNQNRASVRSTNKEKPHAARC